MVVVRDVMVVDGLGFLLDSPAVRQAKGATWESQCVKPCLFLSQWPNLG